LQNKILKGGIIGAGKMGLLHSALINCFDHSTLVAICEPSKLIYKTIKEFAPDIKTYKDYKEMLKNEELDFVFISTPTFLHVPIALDCVKYGCHFFVEKPLSANSEEALPLIEALEGKHLITMTGYMMRYLITFQRAKEIIDRGVLGKIITFNATMYVSQLFKKGKGWRYDRKKSGGGVIIMQATHVIDMLCWFFGDPKWVNASLLSPYSKTTEDFGHIIFNWENGLMGWLDSSWSVYNHRMLETTIEIHAQNGTLIVNDDTVRLFLKNTVDEYRDGWTILRKPEMEKGVAIDIGGPHYTRQDEAFVNAIVKNRPLESDVFNAFNVQNIVDAIYSSSDSTGKTTEIK